nr:serine/arginine repetitive matrix protein 1-like [Penaeus vannamei]
MHGRHVNLCGAEAVDVRAVKRWQHHRLSSSSSRFAAHSHETQAINEHKNPKARRQARLIPRRSSGCEAPHDPLYECLIQEPPARAAPPPARADVRRPPVPPPPPAVPTCRRARPCRPRRARPPVPNVAARPCRRRRPPVPSPPPARADSPPRVRRTGSCTRKGHRPSRRLYASRVHDGKQNPEMSPPSGQTTFSSLPIHRDVKQQRTGERRKSETEGRVTGGRSDGRATAEIELESLYPYFGPDVGEGVQSTPVITCNHV